MNVDVENLSFNNIQGNDKNKTFNCILAEFVASKTHNSLLAMDSLIEPEIDSNKQRDHNQDIPPPNHEL